MPTLRGGWLLLLALLALLLLAAEAHRHRHRHRSAPSRRRDEPDYEDASDEDEPYGRRPGWRRAHRPERRWREDRYQPAWRWSRRRADEDEYEDESRWQRAPRRRRPWEDEEDEDEPWPDDDDLPNDFDEDSPTLRGYDDIIRRLTGESSTAKPTVKRELEGHLGRDRYGNLKMLDAARAATRSLNLLQQHGRKNEDEEEAGDGQADANMVSYCEKVTSQSSRCYQTNT